MRGYVSVGGGKVDVGIVFVSDSAALAVGVVGGGEICEVTSNPCVDAQCDDDGREDKVDNKAAAISALPLFD